MSGNILVRIAGALLFIATVGCASFSKPQPVVMMTDFGLKDGAVSAMKGVTASVDSRIPVSDLTHEIQTYSIWDAAFRLQQSYKYWPKGTVFVTVVDPGVGSGRKSIVGKTKSGHYFVGPDNGVFTLVGDDSGWSEVRWIKESDYRRKGSEESYTFHGRDVYAYVGALLAGNQLNFNGIGEKISPASLVRLSYQRPEVEAGKLINGNIPVLDTNFGNVWTNIPRSLVLATFPKARKYHIRVRHNKKIVYEGTLPLVDTFAGVSRGAPLLYFNSMLNLSIALNQANFSARHNVRSGPDWSISISPR